MTRSTSLALTAGAVGAGLLLTACGGGGPAASGGALTDDKVVLGVLNDQSGVYKDVSGPNSKVAVEMAVEDYKKKYGDKAVAKTIEIVTADHQNKPDIANTKAQEMYDRQKADIILDVPTSSAALAVAGVAKAKKKLYINIGAGSTALTGAQCNKYTFHYAYDTWMLAHGTGATVTQAGGKKWNLVYPDYAFGQDMQKSFTDQVTKAGGSIGQTIPTPFPNDNFATFITKAAADNPDVIGTMHAGGDLINFVKQFNQSGLKGKTTLAVGLLFITDIHSLGVDQFEGTQFTDAWYWNFDDKNRAFADRFMAKTKIRPTFAHAANYSAAMNYLEAVQATGTDDADKVVGNLEGKKIDDVFLRNGEIRKEDHRVIHDVYLNEVKSKDEVTEEWDYRRSSRPSRRPRPSSPSTAPARCPDPWVPSSSTRSRAWPREASTLSRPSAWPSSSASSASSTSATAPATCSVRWGRALLLDELGIGFWAALAIIPVVMFAFGVFIERALVHWLVALDPLYNFLLTFGLTLVLVDLVKRRYGVSGMPYEPPPLLAGRIDVAGVSLSTYQVFAVGFSLLVCVLVWLAITRTRVGMIVRAATEDAERTRALGINVGRWVTPVFGFGIALAGLAGVLAAPFRAVTADMGSNFIIILFAVVVIGGLGSIIGAVVAGFLVGLVEAYGQAYVPALAQVLIFVLMAAVILVRPAGLFGREDTA